jgi:glutamate dehydrogenase (NADP+)
MEEAMIDVMTYAKTVIKSVQDRYEAEPEFNQAVEGILSTLDDYLDDHKELAKYKVLERLVEPERSISFRVTWMDDKGELQVNRGYRVQFSSALGPYKGGLRFHPSVNLSILKFLGFEQIFKNSLTGLWLGGAKGGSDFDPKGKSDAEIMNFCQAFMTELFSYIGPETDIPAGDIGVGSREIGYLFGWYKKLANKFHGSLTGKGSEWGGSSLRPEATGYGLLYFVAAMLDYADESLDDKSVVISGSGNVAQFAAQKAMELGANVVALSDSDGFIYDAEGLDETKLEFIKELKNVKRGRIKEYVNKFKKAKYTAGQKPWSVEADIYLPCATQNEIQERDAKQILKHNPLLVAEGANMPSSADAIRLFQQAKILYAPDKASNAGGVAVSGLEMSQNMTNLAWSEEEIDERLHEIMEGIHEKCVKYGKKGNTVDYVRGANVAGFARVSEAIVSQGLV